MTHAIGYMGPFEINFDRLAPGLLKYERRDGTFGDVATPPPKVDGIFFGYMERAGQTI